MTFRKRFNTMSRSTKKNRLTTANNWWTHITKIMTKLADKELAVLTPDEHTSFWNGGHLNNYLHFLISSIQTIDKEMKNNKSNDLVLFELLEMYACVRNCVTYICLFNDSVNTQSGNKKLVKESIKSFIKYFRGKGSLFSELIENHSIIYWDTKFIIHRLEKQIDCGLLIMDEKFKVSDSEVKQCIYRCTFGNRFYATNEQKDSKMSKSYSGGFRNRNGNSNKDDTYHSNSKYGYSSNNGNNINSINRNCSQPCQSQRLAFLEQGNNAFWFVYLEQLLSIDSEASAKNAREAYECLQHVFALIISMAKQNATEAMVYSLSALTLTKWLLTIAPFEDRSVLAEVARAVQIMSSWPSPYGYVALQVLDRIYNESKIPGRMAWEHNINVLGELIDFHDIENDETVELNKIYIFSGENSNSRSYIFYHFWDDVREDSVARKKYSQKVDSIKRLLLINFISSSFLDEKVLDTYDDVESKDRDREIYTFYTRDHLLSYIRHVMSSEDVQRFVNDTFYIMEDLAKLSHVEVFENRVKVVTKLVKNLQFEYFKDLKRKKEKSNREDKEKIESLNIEEKETALIEKAVDLMQNAISTRGEINVTYKDIKSQLLEAFDDETYEKCKPRVSGLLKDFSSRNELKQLTWSDRASYQIKLKSFKRSNVDFPSLREGNSSYVDNADLKELEDLVLKFDKQTSICLLGGIEVVHRYVCAYVSFVEQNKFNPNIRLYLIPSQHSFLAEAIAAVDPWYCRHVYIPFCYPSWTIPFVRPPWVTSDDDVEAEESPKTLNTTAGTGPQKVLSSLKQHYFQNAESTFSVPIFMCECWERVHDTGDDEESNDSSSDLSIPFCSSLEIGIYPEVYSSKYADDNSGSEVGHKDSYSSLTYEKDVKKLRKYMQYLTISERESLSKTFEIFFLKKSIKKLEKNYELRDIRRTSEVAADKKLIPIESSDPLIRFCVSNIPEHEKSKVSLAETYLYCSMYKVSSKCEEIIANKKNRKELRTKDIKEIERCLTNHEDASTFVANDIVIKSRDGKGFSVMLDGEIFGPYTKLRIKPTYDNLSLDIQQFVPQIITKNKPINRK